jgi:hypothetical protein
VNGQRYCDVLDNFVFPFLFLWNGPEIWRIIKDGEPPHFAFCDVLWLDINFLAPCTGRRDPTGGPPSDLFCGVGPKKKYAHQNEVHLTN